MLSKYALMEGGMSGPFSREVYVNLPVLALEVVGIFPLRTARWGGKDFLRAHVSL